MSAMRVVLLTDDLMFGSKVEGMIREAGAEPVLVSAPADVTAAARDSALVVVDLVTRSFDGLTVEEPGLSRLAYYAHTDDDVRRAALEAGFDLVVPRSRMMREGAGLIAKLLAD
ncbi:MAG: hypothetical protein WAO61_02680 [Solirubrobacterales bacterium]